MSPIAVLRRALAPGALLLVATACATTGSTFGSGVGDRLVAEPPYYAGDRAGAEAARPVHLPVAYQRGGSQSAIFDPAGDEGSAVARLTADMTAYLDSLGVTARLTTAPRLAGTPPDVMFGCEMDAMDECVRSDSSDALGRGRTTTMRLAVGRPSAGWIAALQPALDEAGAAHALLLTLEVGQYWTTQRGWRGDKAVQLGTNHEAALPWLTSVETPVTVLQLTGALVGADGKAVRIGAEGLMAKRTSIVGSALGVQAVLSDEDVAQLRTLRREDLPGQPLVWQVALRELVGQLTGRPALTGR